MTKSPLIPLLVLAVAACSDTADTTPDEAPVARDDTPARAVQPPSLSCGTGDAAVLTGDGIGALRVGATVTDVRGACAVVRDTTRPGVEGTQERRVEVDMRRDTVGAVVVDDRVWRIHVDGSAFRTADGLGVGSTVAELRRDRAARVMPGEGTMYVTLDDHCGVSFRLSGVPFGRARQVAELPAGGRVVEVLAFGCESPQP